MKHARWSLSLTGRGTKGEGHYSDGLAESDDYKDFISARSALTMDPIWGFAPSPPKRGRDPFGVRTGLLASAEWHCYIGEEPLD
jgi:hypothetical protein